MTAAKPSPDPRPRETPAQYAERRGEWNLGPCRETPTEYAERHRQHASDGRHDRILELIADVEVGVQGGLWALSVQQVTDLNAWAEARGDRAVAPSGDHRPRAGRLYSRGTDE